MTSIVWNLNSDTLFFKMSIGVQMAISYQLIKIEFLITKIPLPQRKGNKNFFLFLLIDRELISNIILVSGIQHSNSAFLHLIFH